jgi:4-hydroxy-tetrahydrodipicolinate reductase
MNRTLKIAIIGYGKMGHEIERFATSMNMDIVAIIDNPDDWQKFAKELKTADVAIEFTSPGVVVENLTKLMDLGIPVVTGTTGWMHKLPEIQKYCEKSNGSLFYASNFSIGVNLFFAVNKYLAKLLSQYPEYMISAEETHHTQKLDAPSGTAIIMLEDILKENDFYTGWKLLDKNPKPDEIPIDAHRIDGVTGKHIVNYSSPIDTISLKHEAFNREGFARGALMAAAWLKGKKGTYTMNDLLNI